MDSNKVINTIQVVGKFSFKGFHNSKREFQELIKLIWETVNEIEGNLSESSDKESRHRLRLCLLQLQYTISSMSHIISDHSYIKKTDILKLLSKKINLCLHKVIDIFSQKSLEASARSENYHSLISRVCSAVKSSDTCSNLSTLIDDLLCSSLTVAKLSVTEDFKEISASCKNILSCRPSEDSVEGGSDQDFSCSSYLLYQINILDRRVNTAMLRLFLHIMSYPEEALKKLIRKCGCTSILDRFSEDVDDEISEFDITCDRIALIGNFAMMSSEDDSLKLKVQNSLANLEFYEESLVPACVSFYLDPCHDKREFLKYLTNEWKSQVLVLNSLLDSIVDSAAFSLVVFEDVSDLIQSIKKSEPINRELMFVKFHRRCQKFLENLTHSPDSITDVFLSDLKKTLELQLRLNNDRSKIEDLSDANLYHLDVILSLIDQISEHLNTILNNCSDGLNHDFTSLSLKEVSPNCSISFASNCNINSPLDKGVQDWGESFKENRSELYRTPFLDHYLQKANLNSPFLHTLYQKTPIRNKIKDNIALSLDVSTNLGESFDA